MHNFTVDGVIIAAALLLQAALVFTLLRKQIAPIYPVFTLYLILNLVEDPVGWLIHSSALGYTRFYFIVTVLDYVLQLLVVIEVGWSVFQPARRSLPFPLLPVSTVAILACIIVAVGFSPHIVETDISRFAQVSLRITLGLSILKLLLFGVLAGFAQMLGIGWKNHVLQLATGLAFFAAASLLVQVSSSHLSSGDRASYIAHMVALAQMQSAAYLATLGFWIWAFSRNEAPRKDFTPQMQQVLVTIAQSAKRTRLAVTRSTDRR